MNTSLKSANCIHGMDSRFCSLCARASNAVGISKPARIRAKGSPSTSRIGYAFEDNGSVLALNMDLPLGWRLHEKDGDGGVVKRILVF